MAALGLSVIPPFGYALEFLFAISGNPEMAAGIHLSVAPKLVSEDSPYPSALQVCPLEGTRGLRRNATEEATATRGEGARAGGGSGCGIAGEQPGRLRGDQTFRNRLSIWSGRSDLNRRPP